MAVCFTAMIVSLTFTVFKHSLSSTSQGPHSPHVAVVDLNGVIYSSSSFIKDVESLLDNTECKAAVIRINSPGGLVGPSQEIYQSIKSLDQKIPVVISMGSLAASGGYYAALGGRKIFANPGTLTASIGVIMEFMNTEKLMDWAKLERFSIKAGKLKDVGSPTRKMLPEEKAFLQELLNDVHVQFRQEVKARRSLTDSELDQVADGRVMTGAQAHKAKLVDALGGYQDAVKEAKKLAGLPDKASVVIKEPTKGLLRELLLGQAEEENSHWDRLVNSLVDLTAFLTQNTRTKILYLTSGF